MRIANTTYPVSVQLNVASPHQDQQFGEFGRPPERRGLLFGVEQLIGLHRRLRRRRSVIDSGTVVISVIRQIMGQCGRSDAGLRFPPVAIDGRFREDVNEIAVLFVRHLQHYGCCPSVIGLRADEDRNTDSWNGKQKRCAPFD